MTQCFELVTYCNNLLECNSYQDYCPNGLQVEGRSQVKRIISGVTASQAMIEAAAAAGADMLLVQHGYFWRGEAPVITGLKQRRIAALLEHGINLVAYHLPLDAHAKYGNNVQLAEVMGWHISGGLEPSNPRSIGLQGELAEAVSGEQLAQELETRLGRKPMFIAGHDRPVKRIAWCTGGAQGYIEKAVALGVDAFITGEVSEQTYHIARECGINFYAAGHHATERYGVQALGDHLVERFDVEHRFIDIDNPV